METKSPFSIPEESLQGLGTNEGFRIVQAFLAKEQNYPYDSPDNSPISCVLTFCPPDSVPHTPYFPRRCRHPLRCIVTSSTLCSYPSFRSAPKQPSTPTTYSPANLPLAPSTPIVDLRHPLARWSTLKSPFAAMPEVPSPGCNASSPKSETGALLRDAQPARC